MDSAANQIRYTAFHFPKHIYILRERPSYIPDC